MSPSGAPQLNEGLRRAVRLVALLNLGYFGIEFTVALAIGSVSLMADSVDFLEDAAVNLLIFAALGDHQVEVVADKGIHAKVDQSVWGDAAEALSQGLKRNDAASGFEAAIRLCGEVLASHFPPGSGNPNEVPDRLVEI